jgi:hypothetical protein
MSSKKEPPKDEEEPIVRATERRDVTEVMRNNAWRILDEMANAQPQFSQSITPCPPCLYPVVEEHDSNRI